MAAPNTGIKWTTPQPEKCAAVKATTETTIDAASTKYFLWCSIFIFQKRDSIPDSSDLSGFYACVHSYRNGNSPFVTSANRTIYFTLSLSLGNSLTAIYI
jgi:hypothetical protein